jgi:Leucine-rich repeat (LRR) protein
VLELTFDQIPIDKFTPEVAKLFQKYNKLSILVLRNPVSVEFSECGIASLDGFPRIPGLVKLSLENNQLDDESVKFIVENFKELQFLSLTANQIKTLEVHPCLALFS